MKLRTPIQRSDTIDYAPLPPACWEAVANSTAVAAGWYVSWLTAACTRNLERIVYIPGEKNPPAKKLSKVDLWIHAREDCAKYEGVGDRDTIVCAGGEGKNVCRADSGGPLFDQKTGLLIGVTSWSIQANKEFCNKAPALFSRVSSYIDFINENLGGPDSDTNSQC